MMDFGVSVGIGRAKPEEDLRIYIELPNLGRVIFGADVARMLAVQLVLNANLIDREWRDVPVEEEE